MLLFEEIPGVPRNILSIVCGKRCTFILLTDGRILNCGENYGQIGHGYNIKRTVFELINGIPKGVSEIVCGSYHTFIRLFDGKILSCGINGSGVLGHNDRKTIAYFKQVKIEINNEGDT